MSTAVDTKNRQSNLESSNGIFQIKSPTFVHKYKPIVRTIDMYPRHLIEIFVYRKISDIKVVFVM